MGALRRLKRECKICRFASLAPHRSWRCRCKTNSPHSGLNFMRKRSLLVNLSRAVVKFSRILLSYIAFFKRINMKKSLLLLALCAFAGQLAAADMLAVCEEYEKGVRDFIKEWRSQAKAAGNTGIKLEIDGAEKDFDVRLKDIKNKTKDKQEAACKQSMESLEETKMLMKKMGYMK